MTHTARESLRAVCVLVHLLNRQLLLAGSVSSYHIPGYTYDVDEFYLEDLIEARLRTALAAQAVEQAVVQSANSSSNDGGSWGLHDAAAKAQAAATAAGQLSTMPPQARVVLNNKRGSAPLSVHHEKEMLGYQV